MNEELVYRPRNDFVVVRETHTEILDGLAMPQTSMEAKRWHVVAIGPKVEGLAVGDRVLMTGKVGEDWSPIPGAKGLAVIREGNVVLIIGEPTPTPARDQVAQFAQAHHCDHCQKETIHQCRLTGTPSEDWRKCERCGWEWWGFTGKYQSPTEVGR